MTKRVKITLSYDGSKFYGSQIQTKQTLPTVTSSLVSAFSSLGVKQIPQASGRTDKGVHALNQVYHIDIPKYLYNLKTLKYTINRIIYPHIHVKHIEFVENSFHARFSAKKRLYRYIVSHSDFSPFISNYAIFMPFLNIEKLDTAAKLFIGTHNFKYFMKNGSDVNSTIRTIYKSGAYRYKEFTILYFLGNGFLRSQVRMMCDFLFKVEKGVFTRDNLVEQLNCTKKLNSSLVEPEGLYLSRIYY